jgi:ribonuclease E
MSSPKQAPKKQEPVPVVKKQAESKSLIDGIVSWVKSLFATEEKEVTPAPKKPQENNTRIRERRPQRGRQGQRRNNRNDSRNEGRNDSRNEGRNDKRKSQNANEDNTNTTSASTTTTATTAKPQKERVQKPKEEKVAERRQRRNNRKKVRVNRDVKNNTHVENINVEGTEVKAAAPEINLIDANVVENSPAVDTVNNVDNTAIEQTANKAKEEQRPRSRRSPRHMRAHGQRRRQNAETSDVKTEITEDPVSARYPEQSSTSSNNNVNAATEVTESTSTVEQVEKVQADALTQVINNPKNEVQQNLPFDEPEKTVIEADVGVNEQSAKVVAEATNAEVATSPVNEVTPAVEVQVESTDSAEHTEEVNNQNTDAPEVEAKIEHATEQPTKTAPDLSEATTEVEAPRNVDAVPAITEDKPATVDEKPKKVRAKVKNIKRKVKAAASKTSGKASAPMTKPETIVSNDAIPRDFVASEDRALHTKSGKPALVANVRSRNSAGPTKPMLD